MAARGLLVVVLLTSLAGAAHGQSVRSHTRMAPRGTTVSESQAVDLTLTVTQASIRPVQVWIRTAGTIDTARKVLTAYLDGAEAAFVKGGERARTFPVESRSSMYQARVTRVVPDHGRVRVEATLGAFGREGATTYVLEIVTDRGDLFSVPNEAIIEEGDTHVVYIQRQEGQYEPQEIKTGIQGELYTQVLDGLDEGDRVVTFGSFFIDSEYKLKGTAQGAP